MLPFQAHLEIGQTLVDLFLVLALNDQFIGESAQHRTGHSVFDAQLQVGAASGGGEFIHPGAGDAADCVERQLLWGGVG